MPLVSSIPLVEAAAERRRAVLACNVSSVEMIQGVIAAAEETGRPAIIQFNRAGLQQIGGVAVAAAVTRSLAEATARPVALHLDHADTLAELSAAADAGFTSLMIDGSTLPYESHRSLAAQARTLAAAAGCPLEAELGHVSGSEAGVTIAEALLTEPDQAAQFVSDTGVNMLAVSIGNVHGPRSASVSLDFVRLERIRDVVPVPLVLHGASGIATQELRGAVERGIAKINIGAAVHEAFARGLHEGLHGSGEARAALAAGREAVRQCASALLAASHIMPEPR